MKMQVNNEKTKLQPKPGIMAIKPYVPGRSQSDSTQRTIKLSSNESALGASPKAMQAYKEAAENLHRYPDGGATMLREAIGQTYNLNPEQIVCGAGSDELIALLIHAYAGRGDEVLYSQYGFLMYPISALKVGATPVKAPEKNYRTDVDALLASVTDNTRIVFVANPNNPTGSYISRDEVLRLRNGLPQHVLLVIDSAYAEFVGKDDYTAGEDIVDLGDNTVMTRTFSKIYGLSALRIGWAYCPPSIIEVLHRLRGPFNVSDPAIKAAAAVVQDTEFTSEARHYNDTWLAWMDKHIKALGLTVYPSVANFLLVEFPKDPAKDSQAANQFLHDEGIIVRDVQSYDLPQCLRITIGREDENKACIDALTRFMQDA